MSTKGKKGWIIAFVLPCVVLFCLVYAIPFIMVITTSFCNYTLTQAPAFQGLENFKIIFADYDFVVSIVNTLKWVPGQVTESGRFEDKPFVTLLQPGHSWQGGYDVQLI